MKLHHPAHTIQHKERLLSVRGVHTTPTLHNDAPNCTDRLENFVKSHTGDEPHTKVGCTTEEQHSVCSQRDESAGTSTGATPRSPSFDINPSGYDESNSNTEDLYDPLFDDDFDLQGFDAVLPSRKRDGDEAFPDECASWDQPSKRQVTEPKQDLTTVSPDNTPSLSSLDSVQPDQGGTGPHTPSDIEKQQSLATLFDPIDLLLEDPTCDIALNIPDGEIPFSFDFQGACNGQELKEDIRTIYDIPDQALELPSISEITKERFSLNDSNIIDNTHREVLQQVYVEPEYASPYPAHGGPLGYLPSAPGLHVRCMEVSEDRINYRLSNLRTKVHQLTLERNKYKQELARVSDLTAVDPETGKTKRQLLLEQNAMLRRVCSRHRQRVEEYKQEAADWKNKLHHLSVTHNCLLYEIQTQNQVPKVNPMPPGYKPPRVRHVNPDAQAVDSSAPPSASAGGPSVPGARAEPLMIDLTDEPGDDVPAETPEEFRRRTEMFQSLRAKKYPWLADGEAEVGNPALRMTSGSPAQGSPSSAGGPQDSGRSRDHRPANPPRDIASADPAHHDADLAQNMEPELGQV
ncbi:hypothetical protein BO94DRAFT_123275 [Aspergillus sclerotioniger CBS 115572]|uniref:Uncharacterized protein n=1 Tax=Aspergillus sclerotioniger CBS 115572 TaxID=1450535 RepID=A0A317WAM9_9EURO|nr:hypothetical protein BO94DRAFT_123275 [Aspergillus sclerotioniger CBS 115572]PWY83259.1 hypothetical protein BO94DRAFT_123275 [Aspergillus sclerotioniger CBS 115572]